MQVERFRQLVQQLEQESAQSPGAYRAKVALLAVLGFFVLALLLGAVGLGLVLLAGLVLAVVLSGGTALLLLVKFGKLLLLLAWPLWLLVRSGTRALFFRMPAPEGRPITASEAPALFAALDDMRRRMKGPRFDQVLVVDGVNAAVLQRPAFGLVGWPRNYLLLGLPLLEALPPQEALAVVAHEYGHLAGSHGRFGAWIYRLRITWGTVQAFAEQVQGWLGRLVAPLVRWYAPYFNAYSFVLARDDEYRADAASAELVGRQPAVNALKRVQLVAQAHDGFMQSTLATVNQAAHPPADLLQRWSAQALFLPDADDGRRHLQDALDREGRFDDTHPTLRARLAALGECDAAAQLAPPQALEPDRARAATAWLTPALLQRLRSELGDAWARSVEPAWGQRHAELVQARERLNQLHTLAEPDAAAQLERLRLTRQLEPEVDLRAELAAFNAAHPDQPLGLFLEGAARLEAGEREGLALLERTLAVDPEATKPACERAHAFLLAPRDEQARQEAEVWAERWRQRDALETARSQQLATLDAKTAQLQPHGLSSEQLEQLRSRVLQIRSRRRLRQVLVARRVVPADPQALQILLAVRLKWWSGGKEAQVVQELAAIEWPLPVMVASLTGSNKPLRRRFAALADAVLPLQQ